MEYAHKRLRAESPLRRDPLNIRGEHNQEVERILSALARELFVRNEQREAILLTGNAEHRYLWVKTHEPWLLDRVAQYQLASYLGMEPVSLSRD